jgi:hypothetical protein
LGLGNNTSSDRIRLALYKPRIEHSLWALLKKNLKKYKSHFGEPPSLYVKIDAKYTAWFNKSSHLIDPNKTTHKILKELIETKSINEIAKKLEVKLGTTFKGNLKKYYYVYPDKRDALLFRYIVNYGFFNPRLFPVCQYCDQANSRKHVTNDCDHFYDVRSKLKDQLDGIDVTDLEQTIIDIYFSSDNIDWKKHKCYKMIDTLKKFISELYIGRDKR